MYKVNQILKEKTSGTIIKIREINKNNITTFPGAFDCTSWTADYLAKNFKLFLNPIIENL